MDHAEVQLWLEEAFFRPGALRRLDEGETDTGDAQWIDVRQHLADCPACRRELRSLRATAVALDVGLGPSPAAAERALATVRQLGMQRPVPARSSAPSLVPRLTLMRAAAVLALVVVAFAAGALLGFGLPADEPAEGPQLAHTAAMMGELLSDSDAQQLSLVDDAGRPAGLVVHSPSRQQLAVLTGALEPPATGRYECYLKRNGETLFIGPMHFEDGTAFWAGPVDPEIAAGRQGDRFVVMHGPDAEPALWGDF